MNLLENMEKYADLILKVGINLEKGQKLVIKTDTDSIELARIIQEKAYDIGARDVYMDISDSKSTLTKFLKAPDEAFKEYPSWKAEGMEKLAEDGAAFLSIISEDPDLFKNVNPDRLSKWNITASKALKKYRNILMSGSINWCVVASASQRWADKVFPNIEKNKRLEKLWEYIFKTVRVDNLDPISAWKIHMQNLNDKLSYLNKKQFDKLIYNSKTANLEIGLPKDHIWIGGGLKNTKSLVEFVPNLPTEEIFTMPDRNRIDGIIKSTMPLSYSGNIIENFELKFKDGKVIDFKAEKGEKILRSILETDENAKYIGEVALVPDNSPISNLNLLFYNTLFDENASCHLAFGEAYRYTLKNGSNMTEEEFRNKGGNTSLTHVDFMVGSSDLEIIGVDKEGNEEKIFYDGNWAF